MVLGDDQEKTLSLCFQLVLGPLLLESSCVVLRGTCGGRQKWNRAPGGEREGVNLFIYLFILRGF